MARKITDQITVAKVRRSALVETASEIAYLAGGIKAQRARVGLVALKLGAFAEETSAAEKIARDVLGQDTYADIEKRGSRLFIERSKLRGIVSGELSISTLLRDHPVTGSTSSRWQSLSAAEQEVAILAAAGFTNRAIGVRRGTSTKTTEAQVTSIFQKLMIDAREDIIRFVPQDQRNRVSDAL